MPVFWSKSHSKGTADDAYSLGKGQWQKEVDTLINEYKIVPNKQCDCLRAELIRVALRLEAAALVSEPWCPSDRDLLSLHLLSLFERLSDWRHALERALEATTLTISVAITIMDFAAYGAYYLINPELPINTPTAATAHYVWTLKEQFVSVQEFSQPIVFDGPHPKFAYTRDRLNNGKTSTPLSYWSGGGRWRKQAKAIEAKIASMGSSSTLQGELVLASKRIEHDYFNNGFCNADAHLSVIMFLEEHLFDLYEGDDQDDLVRVVTTVKDALIATASGEGSYRFGPCEDKDLTRAIVHLSDLAIYAAAFLCPNKSGDFDCHRMEVPYSIRAGIRRSQQRRDMDDDDDQW